MKRSNSSGSKSGVFAQHEDRLRVETLQREEFVSRFADSLSEHDQLAGGRHLGGRSPLLQLQGRHRLGQFEQIRGLPIDGTQGLAHLGQDFFLAQDGGRVVGRTGDQRQATHELGLPLRVGGHQTEALIARHQTAHIARQHVGALFDVEEGLRMPHQRLRDRLGQALRLHQRLPGARHLLRDMIRLAQRDGGGHAQDRQGQGQHHRQPTLVHFHRSGTEPGREARDRVR